MANCSKVSTDSHSRFFRALWIINLPFRSVCRVDWQLVLLPVLQESKSLATRSSRIGVKQLQGTIDMPTTWESLINPDQNDFVMSAFQCLHRGSCNTTDVFLHYLCSQSVILLLHIWIFQLHQHDHQTRR